MKILEIYILSELPSILHFFQRMEILIASEASRNFFSTTEFNLKVGTE